MLAKEAKKITNRKKLAVTMMSIYDQIRKEAECGNSQLTIPKYNWSDGVEEILKEDGYKIETEDDGDYHSARVTGYIISWV